jgi:hypothetical protein
MWNFCTIALKMPMLEMLFKIYRWIIIGSRKGRPPREEEEERRGCHRQQRAVSRAAEQQSSRAAVKCSKQSSRVDSKHRAWSPMKRRRKLRRGVWVVWGEGSGV